MLHTITDAFMHAPPLLVYLSVLVVLLLESTGVPIANTTLLLLAGALASLGHVNIWLLAIVALSGSTLGACSAYALGAYSGRKILSRLARFFPAGEQKTQLVERWFQQGGIGMIFFSRMLPYVRPFACFPAGIWRMSFPRFVASACAGSLFWCSIMLSIGWCLGSRWRLALHAIHYYTLPMVCLLVLCLAGALFCMHLLRRRFNAQFPIAMEECQDPKRKCEELLTV